MSKKVTNYACALVVVCCALGCFVTDAAQGVKTRTNPNLDQQQVLVNEDDYIAFADSGLRDEFDWQLLKSLNSQPVNTVVSPVSLKIILGLLYDGSAGLTEQEIQNVLQFSANKTEVRLGFSKLISSLTKNNVESCDDQRVVNGPETYTLNLGTRIYMDSQLQAQQAFQTKACQKFRTKIEPTNFTNAEKSCTIINQYVNRVTLGKISSLVTPDDVANSRLIFVNALYFRGYWSHQFPKNQSHQGGFYLSPQEVVQVDYMATTDHFFYLESRELSAKMIRIPYKGKKFAMIVILPYAKTGLSDLIQRLNVMNLKQLVNIMDKQSVDLILPKFKFEFQTRLAPALQRMGIVSMFQNTASLPGITRGDDVKLQVSDIIQKAGIEINEEGSTAFAASDVQIGNKFGDAQSSFNATHPFLFYIEDQESHSILFIGKVVNPLTTMAVPLPTRFGEAAPGANAQFPPGQQFSYLQPALPPPANVVPQVNGPEPDESVAKRFNYFDLELLRLFVKELAADDNVFISPASLKATLGMILEGAHGPSAVEIAKTLRLPLNQQYVREQLKKLLYDVSDTRYNTLLYSANGIFVSDKLQVSGAYKRNADEIYKANVNALNFANVEQSVKTINTWVKNATRGLIPEVVTPDTIGPDSSIVITNALYFHGTWKYAFDPTLTSVRCFHLQNGQCQNSYMMQSTAELNYRLIGDIDAHALEIPYSNEQYAMLILLPQMRNNIQALIRDLQHATFNSIVDKLEHTEVLFEIPKFQIDYSAPLVSALKQLGIREIFSTNANLSGIVTKDRIAVDSIIQKTHIEINEHGTVAAAATAAIVIPLMGSAAPRVIANHPFLFFIYKRDNRNIIFEGIVNKPTEAAVAPQQPLPQRPTTLLSRSSFNTHNYVRPAVAPTRQFRQF